jgi:hypothetical protein
MRQNAQFMADSFSGQSLHPPQPDEPSPKLERAPHGRGPAQGGLDEHPRRRNRHCRSLPPRPARRPAGIRLPCRRAGRPLRMGRAPGAQRRHSLALDGRRAERRGAAPGPGRCRRRCPADRSTPQGIPGGPRCRRIPGRMGRAARRHRRCPPGRHRRQGARSPPRRHRARRERGTRRWASKPGSGLAAPPRRAGSLDHRENGETS